MREEKKGLGNVLWLSFKESRRPKTGKPKKEEIRNRDRFRSPRRRDHPALLCLIWRMFQQWGGIRISNCRARTSTSNSHWRAYRGLRASCERVTWWVYNIVKKTSLIPYHERANRLLSQFRKMHIFHVDQLPSWLFGKPTGQKVLKNEKADQKTIP